MLYFLQLLRFIAACLVLFFHLLLFDSGYKGVDVFFVISGFVMYYTLYYRPRPKAFKFLVNRFTKIFFLYWVAIGVLYFIMPPQTNFFNLRTVLLFPGHTPVLGVSWSLSYELYFYFLIGIVVYVLPEKLHKAIFFVVFTLSTAFTLLNLTRYSLRGSVLNFLLGQNLWQFLLGILSGYFFTHQKVNRRMALAAATVFFLLFMFINFPFNTPVSYVVYGPLAFGIVWLISAFETGYTLPSKTGKIIKVMGEASYAIYLFGPIITLIIGPDTPESIALIIGTTVVVSIVFNRFVESPFLKWSRDFIFGKTEKLGITRK